MSPISCSRSRKSRVASHTAWGQTSSKPLVPFPVLQELVAACGRMAAASGTRAVRGISARGRPARLRREARDVQGHRRAPCPEPRTYSGTIRWLWAGSRGCPWISPSLSPTGDIAQIHDQILRSRRRQSPDDAQVPSGGISRGCPKTFWPSLPGSPGMSLDLSKLRARRLTSCLALLERGYAKVPAPFNRLAGSAKGRLRYPRA